MSRLENLIVGIVVTILCVSAVEVFNVCLTTQQVVYELVR